MYNCCKYKNIFGEPNKNWRKKYRFLDISYIDVFVVIIFGLLIYKITKYKLKNILFTLFFSGILAHRIFCVRTRVDRWIFN
jgi:hypothetical protein